MCLESFLVCLQSSRLFDLSTNEAAVQLIVSRVG